MSRKVKPLAMRAVDEIQIVLGSMELGDLDASLAASKRCTNLSGQITEELQGLIRERHESEIAAIEAVMPAMFRNGRAPRRKPTGS